MMYHVADCAHSLGASRVVAHTGAGEIAPARRYCGRIAHFSSFSFHAVKNFTTAEGGASTWCLPEAVYKNGVTDAQIYKFYQLLSLHGQNKDALAKAQVGAWEYDIIGPWYKCNMTDIMAAIGLKQLDRYNLISLTVIHTATLLSDKDSRSSAACLSMLSSTVCVFRLRPHEVTSSHLPPPVGWCSSANRLHGAYS